MKAAGTDAGNTAFQQSLDKQLSAATGWVSLSRPAPPRSLQVTAACHCSGTETVSREGILCSKPGQNCHMSLAQVGGLAEDCDEKVLACL
jgi:hypothetical protein